MIDWNQVDPQEEESIDFEIHDDAAAAAATGGGWLCNNLYELQSTITIR